MAHAYAFAVLEAPRAATSTADDGDLREFIPAQAAYSLLLLPAGGKAGSDDASVHALRGWKRLCGEHLLLLCPRTS